MKNNKTILFLTFILSTNNIIVPANEQPDDLEKAFLAEILLQGSAEAWKEQPATNAECAQHYRESCEAKMKNEAPHLNPTMKKLLGRLIDIEADKLVYPPLSLQYPQLPGKPKVQSLLKKQITHIFNLCVRAQNPKDWSTIVQTLQVKESEELTAHLQTTEKDMGLGIIGYFAQSSPLQPLQNLVPLYERCQFDITKIQTSAGLNLLELAQAQNNKNRKNVIKYLSPRFQPAAALQHKE
ncbi:MAG TPA: hypothetical protein VGT41_06410 [Candidatus Babeliales bacterium]|nr:hypothetical protein [Candidatus Babeliales bacterium]